MPGRPEACGSLSLLKLPVGSQATERRERREGWLSGDVEGGAVSLWRSGWDLSPKASSFQVTDSCPVFLDHAFLRHQ